MKGYTNTLSDILENVIKCRANVILNVFNVLD